MPTPRPAIAAALLLATLLPAAASADDRADHGYQTWLAAFAHGEAKGSLWIWGDAHLRMYETFRPSAVLLRPGLSWRARPALYLTGGYAWTPSWARTGDEYRFTDEHRIWQQLMWTPRDEALRTAGIVRGRLEQRFRPMAGAEVGLRARVMWRGQWAPVADHPWILVLWDEVFVALHDTAWGQRRGVDQNRLFVGAGWQIRPTTVRVEVGYTNVWLVRPGPDPIAHVLAINTFLGWNAR